jgi:hypothetical protein
MGEAHVDARDEFRELRRGERAGSVVVGHVAEMFE